MNGYSLLTLDFLVSVTALTGTFFCARGKVYFWYFSVFTVSLKILLLYQHAVYAQMMLRIFYLMTSFYGLYYWSKSKEHGAITTVYALSWRQLLQWSMLTLLCGWLLSYLLLVCTDSTVPNWDGYTTAFAFLAHWLTCRKYIQCWLIWLAVDIFLAALLMDKGLPYYGFTHLIYLVMAVYGYLKWRKLLNLRPLSISKKAHLH